MMETILKSLFWIPIVAPLAASVVLAVPSCRHRASWAFFVPFFIGLSMSLAIWVPRAPSWALWQILGDRPATFFVGIGLAALAGGWLGVLLARPAQAFLKSKRLGTAYLFLVVGAIVGFLLFLLPAGLYHDAVAGGSGFGMGTPKLFLDLIRKYYFPVFERLHLTGLLVAGVPALIASGLATLAQAALICSLVVKLWNCRTKPCTATSGSAPSASPEAREG